MRTKKYSIQVLGGNKSAGKQPQAYIALPMKWVREHRLSKGDKLEITYDMLEDDTIFVSIPK
jgi:hypothetical protein